MKKKHIITRRTAIVSGLSAIGAVFLNGCTKPAPPTFGNILRMGDLFTYEAQRALLDKRALSKEYHQSDISSFPATGTINPADASKAGFNKDYELLHQYSFSNYQLSVEGSVSRPGLYSIDALQKFNSRTQITRHTCEEGWTAIAEWTGVPLGVLLQHAGILPNARFINFYGFDEYMESIDMIDAFHPQTILAYGMNGKNLPIQHGAPLRARVETQIGYKSVKYLKRIVVSDTFINTGDSGWAWYVGI
jgi:hypothetical protein